MNYYNPYFTMYPYMTGPVAREGIFSKLFSNLKGINFSSILSNTGKTINLVNQTIPLVKQAQPILKNAKTMFKVMNEFKKIDKPLNKNNIESTNTNSNNYSSGPKFFL